MEAVELCNATEAGLAAYVYTRDLSRALRMAEALEWSASTEQLFPSMLRLSAVSSIRALDAKARSAASKNTPK
jgi:hypothetical protein